MMLNIAGGNQLANLGAFNGQIGRRAIIEAILQQLRIQACVETGTYLGETAQALANYGQPVFTVEVDPEIYEQAKKRFSDIDQVRVYKNDSRSFLEDLRVNPICPFQRVLFYLDSQFLILRTYFAGAGFISLGRASAVSSAKEPGGLTY